MPDGIRRVSLGCMSEEWEKYTNDCIRSMCPDPCTIHHIYQALLPISRPSCFSVGIMFAVKLCEGLQIIWLG